MTKQIFLRSMLVALAASAVLAIVAIYSSSGVSGRLLATTALAAVACGLLLPVAPREAGQSMDLLQRTVAGFVIASFGVCMTSVWDLSFPRRGAEFVFLWFALGVPALAVCAGAMRHRRQADRSLALAEWIAIAGSGAALAVALLSDAIRLPGQNESPFVIGFACIAGTIVSAASAIGRRGPSTERFNPPPRPTRFDRALGTTGAVAGAAWCVLAILAHIDDDSAMRAGSAGGSSVFWPVAVGCMTIALSSAIWCGIGLSRVTGPARFLRHAAAAAACCLGALTTYALALAAQRVSFRLDPGIAQLMQVLAIVGVASLIAALTMMRLARGRMVAADPIDSIDWKCPRCSTEARIGTGEHCCAGCGLAVRLAFRDDRCPACSYDLRGQPADTPSCPECGRARQMA